VSRGATLPQKLTHLQGLHRLDMDTSGVIAFAKHAAAVPPVHVQFRERTVRKQYVAIALGAANEVEHFCAAGDARLQPLSSAGRHSTLADVQPFGWQVTAPLAEHASIATAACVSAQGRDASTDIQILASVDDVRWSHAERGAAWAQPQLQAMCGASLVLCQPHTGAGLTWHIAPCNMCTLLGRWGPAQPVSIVANVPLCSLTAGCHCYAYR
jgi:23S rRNA-/tRNA-specific pseudouridylate synthase